MKVTATKRNIIKIPNFHGSEALIPHPLHRSAQNISNPTSQL